MFDVKVGDKLICNKDRPWSAWTRKGETITITGIEDLGKGKINFRYKRDGVEDGISRWVGNNTCDWFLPIHVNLENK